MNYEEAYEASLEYFEGDELAANVFVSKYALTDQDGDIKEATPDDMHKRLAKEFARVEAKYPNPMSEDEIYGHLKDFKYIVPQGSPMSAIGNDYQIQSLSNCFVIDSPYDSYSGILHADQQLVQLMKRRAGVGLDISKIRPKGMITNNAAKTTDGIGVFMERFSNSCREVAQNGRRGAELMSISVHHPEVETFAVIKNDPLKVTGANISIKLTEEFMEAVRDDTDYELRWPVDAEDPVVTNRVSARKVWDTIITSAHNRAEPGIFFWDNVAKWTPSDAYPKYKSITTNPCLSGDTLIAVADGRGAVSIKELAEEGKDVPVYSTNPNTGEVSIQWGRNPRVTGENQALVRVTLDDKSYYDVTPNHRFVMRDGSAKRADELESGSSLMPFHKRQTKLSVSQNPYWEVGVEALNYNKRVVEHKLISQFHDPEVWNDPSHKPKLNGGLVVHHKDFDGLNNSPDNLEVMSWRDHQKLHAELADVSGEKNPNFSGFSNEEVREHALKLTKELGTRFSNNEWVKYAGIHGLPKAFSSMRSDLGSVMSLGIWAAKELGLEFSDLDPRLVKTFMSMTDQGYEPKIVGPEVHVNKTCEICKAEFYIEHNRREASFCSRFCSNIYVNNPDAAHQKQRIENSQKTHAKQAEKKREDQLRIYSSLKFNLGRKPLMKEWEAACKEEGVSYRVGTKNGFNRYNDLGVAAESYNHKVVSVQPLSDDHTVYNITVDNNHTFNVVNIVDTRYTGVATLNCGEIVLSPNDSCRLLVLNTISFVNDPFSNNPSFDYDKFRELAIVAQRLMDDVIDLELEKIDKILEKIDADPEPDYIKKVELDLWTEIRDTCERGRRTGLGVTAIGDTVAAMGLVYGSDESVTFVEEIYKALGTSAYRSSVTMASERGAFPEYDYELEKEHPFINRIMDEDTSLRKDWEKFGRRNVALTTTAPTGSVSILTQTTSGIEPAFMLSYTRRKKINPDANEDIRVDFIDELGDKWQEFTVYHHGVKTWMDVTGETDLTKSPYHGGTANDIDWINRVKIQGAAQRWICHSISSTVNLPEDVSIEEVKDIYETAWKEGLKGITVYREGSRSGVLVDTAKLEKAAVNNKIMKHDAPKRPNELNCDVYHMVVQGEKWTMFVGLLDGKPYELMGGLSQYVSIPKRVSTGKIIKVKQGQGSRYDFCYDYDEDMSDPTIIQDINHSFENATEAAFTRTISLALRHGASPIYVVEQLLKGSEKTDDLFAFSKAASRVLKNYVEDGTKASGACQDCGSDDVAYQEGCLSCMSCGGSRCG